MFPAYGYPAMNKGAPARVFLHLIDTCSVSRLTDFISFSQSLQTQPVWSCQPCLLVHRFQTYQQHEKKADQKNRAQVVTSTRYRVLGHSLLSVISRQITGGSRSCPVKRCNTPFDWPTHSAKGHELPSTRNTCDFFAEFLSRINAKERLEFDRKFANYLYYYCTYFFR